MPQTWRDWRDALLAAVGMVAFIWVGIALAAVLAP